jgi:hypothetical protein
VDDNKRKVLQAEGQEYVNRDGKFVHKKVRIENEQCCLSECYGSKTKTDEKGSMLSEYYSQTAYLFGLLKKFPCR